VLTSTNSDVEITQLGSSDVVHPSVNAELHACVPRIADDLRLGDSLDGLGNVLIGERREGLGGEGVVGGVRVSVGLLGMGVGSDLVQCEVLDLFNMC
jgi:hypothetical protein